MHLANGVESPLGGGGGEVVATKIDKPVGSFALHRQTQHKAIRIVSAKGNYLKTADGHDIFDATCGASVVGIGHGDSRVKEAMMAQLDQIEYIWAMYFTSNPNEQLSEFLCASTNYQMTKVLSVSSGSEANDVAMKFARQYFMELSPPQPQRTRIIARKQSYHGNTIGALSLCGNPSRRGVFDPILTQNISHVSPCYPYRNQKDDESDQEYVGRLAQELEDEFQRLGPETVCGFLAETMACSTLGCIPAVTGYWKAMKEVCDRHGALIIMDEVMCGMGRAGTLHAWEEEGVVPDLQTIGKGLGSGYAPVAALMIKDKIVNVLDKGTGSFMHTQTYQAHPVSCAAALKVQQIIQEDKLLDNIKSSGAYLGQLLKERLGDHPNVGDIRGKGLFWGIEFVKDKKTKEPFPSKPSLAWTIHITGVKPEYGISLMAGVGTIDGYRGDHIIISPAYNVSRAEIELIVNRSAKVIKDVLESWSA